MIAIKNVSFRMIMSLVGVHIIWLTGWMTIVTALYYYTEWEWLAIPWLPVGAVGTAVAFYLGFKNNQSYDRLWEARKIWGAIVNSCRMWASIVQTSLNKMDQNAAHHLVRRQIGWTYTLRQQLLVPTAWEHVNSFGHISVLNQNRRDIINRFYADELATIDFPYFLQGLESPMVNGYENQTTFILYKQTELLQQLFEENKLDRIKQFEMQKIINDFFEHQGKLERIKKFPLPRQYGSFSFVFVCIFVALLPFGIVGQFSKMGDGWVWLSIPFGVIVGWVYIVMELIGDYSENPFEGLFNDIPMLSICRTIEIDARQIIGDENIPPAIQAKHGLLI